MIEAMGRALLWSYLSGAALTGLYLVFPFGPKLLKRMVRNRQRTSLDWLLLPLEVLVALSTGVLALGVAGALWPATIVYLRRDRTSQEEEWARVRAEEDHALLEEVRQSMEEAPDAPLDG